MIENAFHVFKIKVTPRVRFVVAGGASSKTFTLVFFSCTRRDSVNECKKLGKRGERRKREEADLVAQ